MRRPSVFLFSAAALAVSIVAGAVPPEKNLRAVPEGTRFTTSKNVSFRLIHRSAGGKEMWLDEKSGIVWGDSLAKRARRKDAFSLCEKEEAGVNSVPGHRLRELPTLDDFNEAEKHGFREVLPNMTDGYYWAKSTVPGAANVGHVFSGNLGRPILIVYRSINFENVRCLERSRL